MCTMFYRAAKWMLLQHQSDLAARVLAGCGDERTLDFIRATRTSAKL
jgi:hypothetical protein